MIKVCEGPHCVETFTPPVNHPAKKYHAPRCNSLARYYRTFKRQTFEPKECAKEGCSVVFIPKVYQQRFHIDKCRIDTYMYRHYVGAKIPKDLAERLDAFAKAKQWSRAKAAIFILQRSTPRPFEGIGVYV